MSHDTNNEALIAKEMAEDEKLSLEDLQKKIEKTVKKMTKKRDELAFISNRVRVHDLGQDRFRRRYHHFAFAGGGQYLLFSRIIIFFHETYSYSMWHRI